MKRRRLDEELVAQGICPDSDDALRICMAGLVSYRGERLTSPAVKVPVDAELHVKNRIPYVGRGGFKLAGALDAFGVDPSGLRCLDIGCSTGGFTDCLLQRGAARVLSVDVGRAQFDWRLRNDARVTLLERTNIVSVPEMGYAGTIDLAVCDVSFTSISVILPATIELLGPRGRFVTLVKPQFEARPEEVGEGGVVSDPAVHARVLRQAIRLFEDSGLDPFDICASPIKGAKGNREFFLYGIKRMADEAPSVPSDHVERLIARAGAL